MARCPLCASDATLEEDQRVTPWIDAGPKQLEGTRSRHRKPTSKDLAVRPDDIAIGPRIKDQEHESIHTPIAFLEGQPTIERLDVA